MGNSAYYLIIWWSIVIKSFSYIFLISVCFFLNSCIAFRFNALKDRSSKKISFQEPVPPWNKMQKEGWQAVWQHPNSQSLISYFSSCSSSVPLTSLRDFQQDFLSGVQFFSVLKEIKISYQGQEAHRINLRSSKVQGKRKQMRILLFKKEECFYVLSFLAYSAGALSKDIRTFDQFIEGFKVQ